MTKSHAKQIEIAQKLLKVYNNFLEDNLPEQLVGIVKIHAMLSVVIAVISAFIPVPGIVFVPMLINTWLMYIRINNILDMSFSENLTKSILTGIITNIASNLLLFIVVFVVFFFFGLLKLAVGPGTLAYILIISVCIYFVTTTTGFLYMEALSRLNKR